MTGSSVAPAAAQGGATHPAAPAHAGSPEVTARALLAGLGIGVVLALGNVYMGLKTGWWDTSNITAAILGFVLLAPGGRVRRRPYSLLENNITQTAAGSAAVMPAVLGLLGALPALELLGHRYPTWAIGVWGLALALFGIALALPLRRRFVVTDPLPFPSAVATAEVIRAIHGSAEDARSRTRVLVVIALFAVAVTWFRDGRPALIPGALLIPAGAAYSLGLGLSPMLLGAGILVGARNAMSLLAGSIIAWALVAPALVRAGVARAEYASLVSWLLWPGVAMMVSSGLVRLALEWRSFARLAADVSGLRRARPAPDGQARGSGGPARGWAAICLSGLAVVLTSWLVFDVHPVLGAFSVLFSVGLIVVCVRTAGETDITPVGPLGQLAQLALGLLGPARAPVNIACASVTAGAGVQSAATVSVLKTGHLLAAPTRGQVQAQLLGAVVGALVALPAYALVSTVYGLGTSALPAPGALGWKALAQLAEAGTAAMPPWGAAASAVAAAAAGLLALLERTRAARFVPSPVALGVAFLVPATFGAAIGLGALAWLVVRRRRPAAQPWAGAAGAGAIAGEALTGFAVAALMAAGLLG